MIHHAARYWLESLIQDVTSSLRSWWRTLSMLSSTSNFSYRWFYLPWSKFSKTSQILTAICIVKLATIHCANFVPYNCYILCIILYCIIMYYVLYECKTTYCTCFYFSIMVIDSMLLVCQLCAVWWKQHTRRWKGFRSALSIQHHEVRSA